MTITEMQAEHAHAESTAENLISLAERQKRKLTPHEQQTVDANLRIAGDLKARITAAKANAKPTSQRSTAEIRTALGLPKQTHQRTANEGHGEIILPTTVSREYYEDFYHNRMAGVGPISAASYEGTASLGGNIVPIIVNSQVVPLAPQDSAVRRLATVISTRSDINNPQVLTRAVAAVKAETSAFPVSQQTLGSFKLGANAIALQVSASVELYEDRDLTKTFILDDAASAFLELEESYFLSGSGSGQPQGLLGNVSATTTTEPDTAGNLVSVDAIWELIASLKATYYPTASFLLSRSTALGIRRAQVGSGEYFEPIFHRENGVDLLAGFPVEYSSQMPTAARAATPVLFGAFDRGYVVGDRQGPALLVKVLDGAASALSGLRDILFFRRTDGRVKDALAIQALTIAAS
jgi:HK97 family phage major capsid protein